MRLFKWISITMLIGLLSINDAEAQILKKLKNKVKEATENVIAEKAGQETEKVLDSLLEVDPDYQPSYEEQLQQMMAAGSENIPIEESYSFNTKVIYSMTSTEPGKSSVMNYEMWFSEKESYMATKAYNQDDSDSRDMPSSVLSILDEKNQAMILLMEEQKVAQLLSMKRIKDIDVDIEESESDGEDTEFEGLEKTGRSKKILGYHCEEFVSKNDSGEYSFWISNELSLFNKNMLFNLSKSLGGNTFDLIPDEAKGFMMEMNFENFSKKEKGSMKVISIEKTDLSIIMKDYQLMSLGQSFK